MAELVDCSNENQPPDTEKRVVVSMKIQREDVKKIRLVIGADDWIVEWGDGQTDRKERHVYKSAGRYDIKIRARNMTSLNVAACGLYELNVSEAAELKWLECCNNHLLRLRVENLKDLKVLNCFNNRLEKLDVRGSPKIERVNCGANMLKRLYINGCDRLKVVCCTGNHLKRLNTEGCRELRRVVCDYNELNAQEIHRMAAALPWLSSADSGHVFIKGNPGDVNCEIGRMNLRGWNVDDYNYVHKC